MLSYKTTIYPDEKKTKGYSGSIVQNNFFFLLEIEDGISHEKGEELIKQIKEAIIITSITGLADFDAFFSEIIKTKNIPIHFSFAASFLKDNILYLKTSGRGKIIIRRKDQVATLISGDKSASGYVEKDDLYILTTFNFDDRRIDYSVDQPMALIIDFKDEEVTFESAEQFEEKQKEEFNYGQKINKSLKDYYLRFGQKKTITFSVVILLVIIFIWSVVLGYSRRSGSEAQKNINMSRALITEKINSAEEVASLNMNRALVLLSESRAEYSKLEKQYKNNSTLSEINKLISDAENKILKKEKANYSEFFDLTIDDNTAKGDKLYLEGDSLSILDKTGGRIFYLSLEKKSLTNDQSAEIKKSTLTASYEDGKYFYVPGYGIYLIDVNKKAKKIIENDKDWGVITDFWVFNGNIYLLDTGKDEILKYLNTGDGFGAKNSYFASGQAVDLSWVKSMAIDASLYLGGGNSIIKFTSGLRDGFKLSLPQANFNFTKVFTTKDLTEVYAWDKSQGIVYIMDKDGEFVSQISSDILSKGTDIVVYNKSIFILLGNKIYKI